MALAPGSQKTAGALREAAEAALRDNDSGRAEAAYLQLIEADPADIYGLTGLGFVSRLRGDREEARRRFEQAALVHPAHTWPLLEISAEWSALGKPEAAADCLRRALALDPRDYHCLVGLGRLLRAQSMRDAAIDMFKCAVLHHPSRPSAYAELAADLAHGQRYEEAEAALDAAMAAGGAGARLLVARARILQAAGKRDAALAAWKQALTCEPIGAAERLEAAAALAALGAPDDALAEYRAIAGDAGVATVQRSDAALAACRVARLLTDASQAAGILAQAASAFPDHAGVLIELADFHRAGGRPRDAEAVYRQILDRSATHLAALGGLAIVRRQLGDAVGALALLARARDVDPGNDWIRYEWAMTLRDLGRCDEAGAALEVIAPGASMYPPARMSLGHMARARGDRHWAACYFGQAAQYATDKVDAHCQVDAERRALGNMAGAAEAIAQVFHCAPNSWRGHLASGYLQRASGDAAGALAAFSRAAAAAPGHAQPYVEMAAECLDLGRQGEAEAAIDAALRAEPGHEAATLKKAALLARAGDSAGAMALYADVRAAHLASVWAYLAAAQLWADGGDADEAFAVLAEAEAACAVSADTGLCRAGIMRRFGFLDEAYSLLGALRAKFSQALAPWCHFVSLSIELGKFDIASAMLAAPPVAAGVDAARIAKLHAQLAAARWDLAAAIEALDQGVSLNGSDAHAMYERAKLKLMTFDLRGARADLTAHAALGRGGRRANPSQTHVGQLYDEFILDAGLAREVQALRAAPAREQLAGFAALVWRHPESTAAAIGLMIALRRTGHFDLPWSGHARIPRMITQFWNDETPPGDVGRLMQSWKDTQPGFRIDVFSDRTALDYLRARCGDIVARAFAAAAEPAQRADLFRLGRLFVDGGYFIDADDRARNSLTLASLDGAGLVVHQEDVGSAGNNVMGAAPRHPVVEAALRGAVTAILRGDRDIIWLSTGPGLLTRALARWLAADGNLDQERIAAVRVLTLADMRRVAAMHCHAAYKTGNRAWLNAAFPHRRAG